MTNHLHHGKVLMLTEPLKNFISLWMIHITTKIVRTLWYQQFRCTELSFLQHTPTTLTLGPFSIYGWANYRKHFICNVSRCLRPSLSMDGNGLGSQRHQTHWGRDKIAAISQTTYWNRFSCMKMYEFRLKFHWSLFLMVHLTIFQYHFR